MDLSKEDLKAVAADLEEGKLPYHKGELVTPDKLSAEQHDEIETYRAEYRSNKVDETPDSNSSDPNANTTSFSPDTLEDGRKVFPGGVVAPEGYEYVGDFNTNDEFGQFSVEDTLENVKLEFGQTMSLSYDQDVEIQQDTGFRRPVNGGTIRGRMIHDGFATIYIFRKDDDETETTYFKGVLGHG